MKLQLQRVVGLASAVVTAAVLVGSAQAGHPNDRAGALGVGGAATSHLTVVPDVFERAVARATAHAVPDVFERAVARASGDGAVLPNDRAGKLGVGGVGSGSQVAVPDVFERAVARHVATGIQPTSSPSRTAAPDGGFRWGDAAFGAAAAFGFVVLGAAALTLRQRSRVVLR
jgi:hypothetical protein